MKIKVIINNQNNNFLMVECTPQDSVPEFIKKIHASCTHLLDESFKNVESFSKSITLMTKAAKNLKLASDEKTLVFFNLKDDSEIHMTLNAGMTTSHKQENLAEKAKPKDIYTKRAEKFKQQQDYEVGYKEWIKQRELQDKKDLELRRLNEQKELERHRLNKQKEEQATISSYSTINLFTDNVNTNRTDVRRHPEENKCTIL